MASDIDKLVHSIARWIAGLEPKYGPRFYFMRLKPKAVNCIIFRFLSDLEKMRKGICPFCGKQFKKRALVSHILKVHRGDILEIIEKCRAET